MIKHLWNLMFHNNNFPNTGSYLSIILIEIITVIYYYYGFGKVYSTNQPFAPMVILTLFLSLVLSLIFAEVNFHRLMQKVITNNVRKQIYNIFFKFITLYSIIFIAMFRLYDVGQISGLAVMINILYSIFVITALTFSIIFMNGSLKQISGPLLNMPDKQGISITRNRNFTEWIDHFGTYGPLNRYGHKVLYKHYFLRQTFLLFLFLIPVILIVVFLYMSKVIMMDIFVFVFFLEIPLFLSILRDMGYKYVKAIDRFSPYFSKVLLATSVIATFNSANSSKSSNTSISIGQILLAIEILVTFICMIVIFIGTIRSNGNDLIRLNSIINNKERVLSHRRIELKRLILSWLRLKKVSIKHIPSQYHLIEKDDVYSIRYHSKNR